MRKKLLLIQPVVEAYRERPDISFPTEPLALEIIAGLTPADWEIQVIDERLEALKTEDPEEADLVGLTAYTSTAPRAYEIAGTYKKRGIPVVMGGVHATVLPEEALDYVDTVVTGEAENIWGKVISDFEARDMQRVYNGGNPDLTTMPKPRRDVIPSHYHYPGSAIQTGRGCPHNCDFCAVTGFNGFRRRKFPLEEALEEFEAIPQSVVAFLDDNLIGYSKKDIDYALGLFRGIIDRGIKKIWWTQTSFHIAQHEILKYAAKSGCRMVSIGIEAENPAALREMNKKLNLKLVNNAQYEDLFALMHEYGVAVDGGFIYGLDADTPETLERRTDFIINSDLDIGRISPLTPLPGTRLFERMRKEGRLIHTNFPDDWELYDLQNIVFKPASMEPEELTEIVGESKKQVYSEAVIEEKFQRTRKNTDEVTAHMVKSFNLGYLRIARILGIIN
ncbi:MAG: B12-binding domain-containing radical SAM protein [Desulfobacterales bacterium]|nr:B12-binding domain-containing radical SAM protein [Desulfobacterales bacterium]